MPRAALAKAKFRDRKVKQLRPSNTVLLQSFYKRTQYPKSWLRHGVFCALIMPCASAAPCMQHMGHRGVLQCLPNPKPGLARLCLLCSKAFELQSYAMTPV